MFFVAFVVVSSSVDANDDGTAVWKRRFQFGVEKNGAVVGSAIVSEIGAGGPDMLERVSTLARNLAGGVAGARA